MELLFKKKKKKKKTFTTRTVEFSLINSKLVQGKYNIYNLLLHTHIFI